MVQFLRSGITATGAYLHRTWPVWAVTTVVFWACIVAAVVGQRTVTERIERAAGCVAPGMPNDQRAAARGIDKDEYRVLFGYSEINSIEYCRMSDADLQAKIALAGARKTAAEAEGAGGLWLRFEALYDQVVTGFAAAWQH